MKRGKDTISVDAWRPQWIGDELAETARLTTEQFGAYQLLLMAYWRNRGALPDDDEELATITRQGKTGWKKLRPKLAVLFQISDGFWHHIGLERERAQAIGLATKRHEKAKKAAAGRWAGQGELPLDGDAPSNAPSNAPSIPGAVLEDCPSPSPSPSPDPSDQEQERARSFEEPHGLADVDSGQIAHQVDLDDTAATAIAIVKGLRQLGIPRAANVYDPRLLEAIAAGVTAPQVIGTAKELIEARPGHPPAFAYVLATARGRLTDAALESSRERPARSAAAAPFERGSALDEVLRHIQRADGDPGAVVGD